MPADAQVKARSEFGDPEREVEALAGVQSRVAHRLVAIVEVGVAHRVGAAEALGDVLAGELDVDAAGPRALGAVGPDEAADLAHDVVEVAGLAAGAAVNVLPCIGSQAHTTGWPASVTARSSGRRSILDLVGTHPADQRQPAGDAVPG